jgi:DNA sulfur modification protein DndB
MNTMNLDAQSVNMIIKDDFKAAQDAAVEESSNTSGFHVPGILFQQGARQCIATAIPIRRMRSRMIHVDSAKQRGNVSDVLSATNRPTLPDHVNNIAEYIIDNVGKRYILPPMTLNVQQKISVYVPKYLTGSAGGHFGTVFLVIPETARLSVTDGGHRTNAIVKAAAEMSPDDVALFDQDAIAVMITLESDMQQVHQDFADCSKTKSLPMSQLAAYDRRNPANGLVLDIIEQCPLFNDKIDSTSKTLSKLTTNLFLTNQVRQLVKELLVGDYAMADAQFEQKAKELLGSSDSSKYVDHLQRFVEFVNGFTKVIHVLEEISKLPAGTPRNKIKDRRAEGWLCLTATGMVIIGRIGYELFRDQVPNWMEYVNRLGQIDWSRDGALWQGNIVRAGKMATQRAPVRVAAENVRRALGLKADHRLDNEIAGRSEQASPPVLVPAE